MQDFPYRCPKCKNAWCLSSPDFMIMSTYFRPASPHLVSSRLASKSIASPTLILLCFRGFVHIRVTSEEALLIHSRTCTNISGSKFALPHPPSPHSIPFLPHLLLLTIILSYPSKPHPYPHPAKLKRVKATGTNLGVLRM